MLLLEPVGHHGVLDSCNNLDRLTLRLMIRKDLDRACPEIPNNGPFALLLHVAPNAKAIEDRLLPVLRRAAADLKVSGEILDGSQ